MKRPETMSRLFAILSSTLVIVFAASAAHGQVVERLDPKLDELIAPDAKLEVLADGFDWSEGPVWIREGEGFLIFNDIPPNKAYKWSEKGGLEVYLHPAGYTGESPRGGEKGANGLMLDLQGRLVLCQHGDRRVARMDAPVNNPEPKFVTLADSFEGKRLNSPNDLVFHSNGTLYFTDPPYGLEKQAEDPAKELEFQGVYRVTQQGEISLVTKEMTRPNGIGLSPDETKLYVANSDGGKPIWMVFPVDKEGKTGEGKLFFDASKIAKGRRGGPDGLAIDTNGNLFATGPGGVVILSPDGKHLGTILAGVTSNCTFGDDGRTLYLTSDDKFQRIKLKAKGLGW